MLLYALLINVKVNISLTNIEKSTINKESLVFFTVEPAINDIATSGVKLGRWGSILDSDATSTVVPINKSVFLFIVFKIRSKIKIK